MGLPEERFSEVTMCVGCCQGMLGWGTGARGRHPQLPTGLPVCHTPKFICLWDGGKLKRETLSGPSREQPLFTFGLCFNAQVP